MNLQEKIRRILREDKDHTNLLKGIIDSSDIFDYKHFCGFDIITPEERSDQYNFLNKNKIPYLIKVYFVGGPNSEVWPRTQAIRNKELDLMEELHEYIKSFVPFNIEMMGAHVNSCDGYKKLMKRKYSTDDLQESIKRILREEDYSPAGKEITPNKIVIHKSNPMFRDKIMENGLKVRAGECYKIYVGYGVKCKPAIFATNSTNKRAWFDSTYDDDIWEINTEMIPDVKWYKDRHFESRSKHIVTFQDIPKEAITLKYKGTGSGDVEKWDKDSPNIVRESIKRILREDRFKGYKRFLKDNIFTDFPEYVINDMFRESGDLDYSEVQGMTKDQIIDYFFNGEGKQYFDRWGGYEGKNAKVVKIEWNDLTEPLQKFLKTKMSGEHPYFPNSKEKVIKTMEREPNLGKGDNEPILLKYNKEGKIEDISGGNHRTYAAFKLNDFKPILMKAYVDNYQEPLQESIRRILREELTENKNLYGKKLKPCSTNPMTGFYRDGYCRTGDDDTGSHTVCAKVTEEFLEFTNSMGNNLDMLEPGDKWCLCAMRWKEAKDNGIYVKVDKSATNIKTLDII